jgi:hypothetical protein
MFRKSNILLDSLSFVKYIFEFQILPVIKEDLVTNK